MWARNALQSEIVKMPKNTMTDSMIERVASAISKACEHRSWDPETMARAAIEAMREPTKAMTSACNDFVDDQIAGSGGTEQNPCPVYPQPDEYWRAMIDAALK